MQDNMAAAVVRPPPQEQQQQQQQQQQKEGPHSAFDFKSRMRLLQSKLHPSSADSYQSPCSSTISSSPDELNIQNSTEKRSTCCSVTNGLTDEDDDDEYDDDSLSNYSATSSSGSSPAPIPPPRFSSFSRRPEVEAMEEMNSGGSFKKNTNNHNFSGDNKRGPLATRATSGPLGQQREQPSNILQKLNFAHQLKPQAQQANMMIVRQEATMKTTRDTLPAHAMWLNDGTNKIIPAIQRNNPLEMAMGSKASLSSRTEHLHPKAHSAQHPLYHQQQQQQQHLHHHNHANQLTMTSSSEAPTTTATLSNHHNSPAHPLQPKQHLTDGRPLEEVGMDKTSIKYSPIGATCNNKNNFVNNLTNNKQTLCGTGNKQHKVPLTQGSNYAPQKTTCYTTSPIGSSISNINNDQQEATNSNLQQQEQMFTKTSRAPRQQERQQRQQQTHHIEARKFNFCHPHDTTQQLAANLVSQSHRLQMAPKEQFICQLPQTNSSDPLFGSSRHAPITKAVQEMLNQKQQKQAMLLVSRNFQLAAQRPPPPSGKVPVPPEVMQRSQANLLGSVSSASMSSISSAATSGSATSNVSAGSGLRCRSVVINSLAMRPLPPTPQKISTTSGPAVRLAPPIKQYNRDSELAEARRQRRRQRLLCARGQCSGSLRKGSTTTILEENNNENVFDDKNELSAANNCEQFCDNQMNNNSYNENKPFLASCVVDSKGKHSLLRSTSRFMSFNQSGDQLINANNCIIDFPLADLIDEDDEALEEAFEEELAELRQQQTEFQCTPSNCDFCPSCNQEQEIELRLRKVSSNMRGWPEELAELAGEDDEDDDLSLSDEPASNSSQTQHLWPLVRLHENPLNLTQDLGQVSSGSVGCEREDPEAETAAALDRSRLLSMRQGQEQNRAAIRMISSDSVQLLVSASSPAVAGAIQASTGFAGAGAIDPQKDSRNINTNSNNNHSLLMVKPAAPIVVKGDKKEAQKAALVECWQRLPTTTKIENAEERKVSSFPATKGKMSSPEMGAGEAEAPGRGEGERKVYSSKETKGDEQRAMPQLDRGQENQKQKGQQEPEPEPEPEQRQQQQVHLEEKPAIKWSECYSPSDRDPSPANHPRSSRLCSALARPKPIHDNQAGAGHEQLHQSDGQRQIQQSRLSASTADMSGAAVAAAAAVDPASPLDRHSNRPAMDSHSQLLSAAAEAAPAATRSLAIAESATPTTTTTTPGDPAWTQNRSPLTSLPSLNNQNHLQKTTTNKYKSSSTTTISSPEESSQEEDTTDNKQFCDANKRINNNISEQQQQQLAGSLLTTAVNRREPLSPSWSEARLALKSDQSSSSSSASGTKLNKMVREPIPTPRNHVPAKASPPITITTNTNDELSILTNHLFLMKPRIREAISDSPNSSILSDSTTLITERVAMNSTELIPKLIERLSRKLVVMKQEQLRLSKEIETNELNGERLFGCMRKQLNQSEFEKISLHANEIEKVTKLILSLKLRLKKVENELEERAANKQQQHQDDLATQTNNNNNNNLAASQSEREQQNHPNLPTLPTQNNSSTIVRGVSDPTSTIGLPSKRNHQHHASLQLPASEGSSPNSTVATPAGIVSDTGKLKNVVASSTNEQKAPPTTTTTISDDQHHKLSLTDTHHQSGSASSTSGESSGIFSQTCSPRNSSELQHHLNHNHHNAHLHHQAKHHQAQSSSNSSDSIFNCTDSAIGSTIAGLGGSSFNIQHQTAEAGANVQSSQSSLHSSGSSVSTSSSSSTGVSRHRKHFESNVSVSSHSSMSSVPHSPPLMSPASTSGGIGTSLSGSSTPVSNSSIRGSKHHMSQYTYAPGSTNQTTTVSSSSKQQIVSKNNNNVLESKVKQQAYNCHFDQFVQPLTDFDILVAKRNKLVSQLEEAHQLEECILKRNNVIVQKILKKYYDESGQGGGEIAEFKQFTRLKSLLLKDTHDVADRIDNAELQLTQLKQTNNNTSYPITTNEQL